MMKSKSMVWRMLAILFFTILFWGGGVKVYAEKKAWVKFANGTLTFMYGEKTSLFPGLEFWLNEGTGDPGWSAKRYDVVVVEFDSSFASARPNTCYKWFQNFTLLQTIKGIEYLNTSNVTNMAYMFNGCQKLTSLDVINFDTSNVKFMLGMFANCSALTVLDVSSFNTSKVTIMQGMFMGCSKIETIFASDKFDVSNVTNSNLMFTNCTSLKGYDASKTDKTYATVNGGYFTNVIRPWVKYADGTLTFQYGYKKTLGADEFWLNEGSSAPGWRPKSSSIKTVVFDKTFAQVRPTSCYCWFYGCLNLSAIEGIENLNTSNVTNMYNMFFNCLDLTSLDLSHFNTSNVTNMQEMFSTCSGITSLDLSHFDTSNVTNMSYMFYSCSSLTSLDLSHFNTSNVTNMREMFSLCSGLTSLDLSHFDTSNVLVMSGMFAGCFDLTSLDLSHFNTSNVKYMPEMFLLSSKIKAIYFGDGFNVNKLGSITNSNIFGECPATLYCSPKQYESFKNNSVIASYGNAVKPYVSINQKSEYGTLCVPVGSSLAEGSFTGFDKLYQVTNADKDRGTITMVQAKRIVPGVPYVYHRYLEGVDFEGKNDMSVITFDVDADASSAVTAPKNENSLLKGTFESMVAKGGSYILQTDGNFHPVAEDNMTLKVGAYRAYLDLSSTEVGGGDEGFGDAKAYRMVFEDGEATGIDRINGEGSDKGVYDQADNQPKVYFDLMGRKVSAPLKGEIYIVNGKKVVYNK